MKSYRPTRYPLRKPTRGALLNIYKAMFRHYGHRNWWPGETPFEVMVGAILTQNTAWKNVERAIQNLKKAGAITPKALEKIEASRLAKLIRPAGYFNVKAKRLKNFINFLKRQYSLNLRKMFKAPLSLLRGQLLEVNGIGEETADSILLYAACKATFVVDAYTRRIFSRHRYLKGNESYQQIQEIFQGLLPKDTQLYNDYHAQVVETGKDYCRTNPRCEACPLKNWL